jgi:hypothetical protein
VKKYGHDAGNGNNRRTTKQEKNQETNMEKESKYEAMDTEIEALDLTELEELEAFGAAKFSASCAVPPPVSAMADAAWQGCC